MHFGRRVFIQSLWCVTEHCRFQNELNSANSRTQTDIWFAFVSADHPVFNCEIEKSPYRRRVFIQSFWCVTEHCRFQNELNSANSRTQNDFGFAIVSVDDLELEENSKKCTSVVEFLYRASDVFRNHFGTFLPYLKKPFCPHYATGVTTICLTAHYGQPLIVLSVDVECSLLWNGCSLEPQLGPNLDPLP